MVLDDLCPILDPTALPRIISREEAIRHGVAPHVIERRLAAGRWQRILPRTYLTASSATPLSWTDRLNAALAFAGPEALLTGSSALAVAGLRCVPRSPYVVVLVPRTNRRRWRSWVRIRRSERTPESELELGPRRVVIARAAADHAGDLRRLDDARALVSEVVRRQLCHLEELGTELEAAQRNGSALLRQALPRLATALGPRRRRALPG